MTEDEVYKVASILVTADDGCSICTSALADQFDQAFPGNRSIIDKAFAAGKYSNKVDWAYFDEERRLDAKCD